MSYDVFISYSRGDEAFAKMLYELLEDNKIKCWMDKEHIGGGEDWSESIADALNSSRALVLILSSNSMGSDNVKDELSVAAKNKMAIIPIRIEDIEPISFFKLKLSRYNWIDIFEQQQERLKEVVNRIKKRIESIYGDEGLIQKLDANEEKYCNALRDAYRDCQITEVERAKLDGIREALGISEERAKILEESISKKISSVTDNEQKYIAKLRQAYADGQISDLEKGILEGFAEALNIPIERAHELEEAMKKEMGISFEEKIVEDEPEPILNAEQRTDSLDIDKAVITFLKKLKKRFDPSRLPFRPLYISDDDNIEEMLELIWLVTENHYFGISYKSKRKENVSLSVGYFSFYTKRDPLFRNICKDLEQMDDLLDEKGNIVINGYRYNYNTDPLSFETEIRIHSEELQKPAFIKHVSNQIFTLSQIMWPVIKRNRKKLG